MHAWVGICELYHVIASKSLFRGKCFPLVRMPISLSGTTTPLIETSIKFQKNNLLLYINRAREHQPSALAWCSRPRLPSSYVLLANCQNRAQKSAVKPEYPTSRSHKISGYLDVKVVIIIKGSETIANYPRLYDSMSLWWFIWIYFIFGDRHFPKRSLWNFWISSPLVLLPTICPRERERSSCLTQVCGWKRDKGLEGFRSCEWGLERRSGRWGGRHSNAVMRLGITGNFLTDEHGTMIEERKRCTKSKHGNRERPSSMANRKANSGENVSNLPSRSWLITYQEFYSVFGMSENLHIYTNRMMSPSAVCCALLIDQLTGHSCSPGLYSV